MEDALRTTEYRELIGRVASKDQVARDELLRRVAGNLERLTHKLMNGFPTVRRWCETGDVLQNASMRLLRSLEHISPSDTRQFFGLAAEQIRRELIDLARHFNGPHGVGKNHASRGGEEPVIAAPADSMAEWQEFHERIAELPEVDREIFGLLYYQGLSQAEAAEILKLSVGAVQQRWQRARLRLHDLIEQGRSKDPDAKD